PTCNFEYRSPIRLGNPNWSGGNSVLASVGRHATGFDDLISCRGTAMVEITAGLPSRGPLSCERLAHVPAHHLGERNHYLKQRLCGRTPLGTRAGTAHHSGNLGVGGAAKPVPLREPSLQRLRLR